jgi:hypothetical protein
MKKKADNLLNYINPFYTMSKSDPTIGDALKNVLGVSLVTIPSVSLLTWLANSRKMKDMKKAINKGAESALNSNMPVMQLDDVKGNIEGRDKAELRSIKAQLAKTANGSRDGLLSNAAKDILIGSLPLLTVPALTWLTAKGTNTVLKDNYADELDAENKAIQDMQDKLDMETLVRMGYLRKRRPGAATINKTAADPVGSTVRGVTNFMADAGDAAKKIFLTGPGVALTLAALGLSAWGASHYLDKSDEVQKLKLLEDRMLGKDQILQSPEVLVDIPQDYEETGKTTAQLIPGISPALLPKEVIEDAVVVEKPKKDAFLG